jgi:hypothetical protein
VREAMRRGVPVLGICLYPVVDFPGWDDFRITDVGLFSAPQADGRRRTYTPLAENWRASRRCSTEGHAVADDGPRA